MTVRSAGRTCGEFGGRKPDGSPCRRTTRDGFCQMHAGKSRSTRRLQAAFLAAVAQLGNITAAAEAAKVSRSQHGYWMHRDPEYPPIFEAAMEEAADRLEAEARRRAVEGVVEPVYHKDKVVGGIRKFSDQLLMFLMKGARPEKYRERHQVDHSGKVDGDVRVTVEEKMAALPEPVRNRIRQFYGLPKGGAHAN